MPERQRTLDSLLRTICNHIHYSFTLFDGEMNILHSAAWPISNAELYGKVFLNQLEISTDMEQLIYKQVDGHELYYSFSQLPLNQTSARVLVILSEYGPIDKEITKQVIEIIRLFANIWGKRQQKMIHLNWFKPLSTTKQ
ncbi:hypothetical protein LQZ18_11415 [Lachnospiraceae bacterium ZAX-1]